MCCSQAVSAHVPTCADAKSVGNPFCGRPAPAPGPNSAVSKSMWACAAAYAFQLPPAVLLSHHEADACVTAVGFKP